MKYEINDQPRELILGGQRGLTTIVNDGSNTVYLDTNPSVSVDNGFVLPPTGQMTWQSNKKLWGVTRIGTSNLRTSVDGELSSTTRGSFDRILAVDSYDSTFLSFPRIETGFLSTIQVNCLPGVYAISGATVTSCDVIRVIWYDDVMREIYRDTISFGINPGGLSSVYIPVKGRYVDIRMQRDASVIINRDVTVFGSNRPVTSIRSYCDPIINPASTGSATALGKRAVVISGWLYSRVGLPSPSERLTVSARITNNMVAGNIGIFDRSVSQLCYGSFAVPAIIGATQRFVTNFRVPGGRSIYISGVDTGGAPDSSDNSIALTWEDY